MNKKKSLRLLLASDFHFPFYNVSCFKILLQFIKFYKPTTIFLLGDFLDFYGISKYLKNKKEWTDNIQYEIDLASQALTDLRKTYKGKIIYIEGNHEFRMARYLNSNAKELASLRCLEIPNLLELKSLNIKYISHPSGTAIYEINKDLILLHGDVARKHAGYSAKAIFDDYLVNAAIGHTHRLGYFSKTGYKRKYQVMEIGCMCDISQAFKPFPNWQNGFGIINIDGENNYFHKLSIINNQLFYGGKHFNGKT